MSNLRYAVVTGANKGIGFGVVQQLASRGITVILTARNEQRGLEAVQNLRKLELDGDILFHQLDVADQDSVNMFSHFFKDNFGKLDILVNNAGVLSGKPAENFDLEKFNETLYKYATSSEDVSWNEFFVENSESAEQCFRINYYGTKRMCEAMIPFLRLSDEPIIVNVSSSAGVLKNISNEWAKGVLSDVENLKAEKIDEVLKEYLNSVEMGTQKSSMSMNGYTISKAAVNAYTRLLSKKCPFLRVIAVGPGYVNTDMTFNTGIYSIEEGADNVTNLALHPNRYSSGIFINKKEESPY